MRLLKTNFISFAVILAHTPDMFTLMDHVICKLWNYSMCSIRIYLQFVYICLPWMLVFSSYNFYKFLGHWDTLLHDPVTNKSLDHKLTLMFFHFTPLAQ